MSLDTKTKKIIMDLLVLALEGDAGKDEFEQLKSILDSSDEARDYYCKAVAVSENIRKKDWNVNGGSRQGCEGLLSNEIWRALAEQEEDADSIILKRPRRKRGRNNKLLFPSVIMSAAAIFIFAVFLKLNVEPVRIEVATLSDSIRAVWDKSSLQNSDRLHIRSGGYFLEEGFVSLVFDNNALVTIEAPARFDILSEDRFRLDFGRIYSKIPSGAIGFSVSTPECLIVDLGTEFGVLVDKYGQTQLHVNKGRTMLVTGKDDDKTSLEVTQGVAHSIDSSGNVVEIQCQSRLFARNINSQTGMIWRGDANLSLADVVGGGNGWGNGKTEVGIDPITGMWVEYKSGDREGKGEFVPVITDKYSYIDGVFVPNGPNQIISTQNHIFKECPLTNNIYYSDIVAGAGINIFDYTYSPANCLLGGKKYGTKEYPSIFMHANIGITFDLDAFRSDIPGADINKFTADAGLSSDIPRDGNAVVWVLLDGEVKFNTGVDQPGKVVPITVNIEKSDRFLSLITTDGGDPDLEQGSNLRGSDSDWCIIAKPELILGK